MIRVSRAKESGAPRYYAAFHDAAHECRALMCMMPIFRCSHAAPMLRCFDLMMRW